MYLQGKEREVNKMTMREVAKKWVRWAEGHGTDKDSINDFCNIYATSYEEYMTLWELLTDNLEIA